MPKPSFPELKRDWREVLALNPRALVFFWESWSPTDLLFRAVLEQVAPDFDAHFAFFAAALEEEGVWPLAREFAIMTTPALVFYHHGEERERTIGFLGEAALRQKLSDWLLLDSMPKLHP